MREGSKEYLEPQEVWESKGVEYEEGNACGETKEKGTDERMRENKAREA